MFYKKNNLWIYYLIIFISISLFLSVYKPIWRDEAFSILLVDHHLKQILNITSSDFSPPFYYILLHIWKIILGNNQIILRIINLIFTIINIFIILRIKNFLFKGLGIKKYIWEIFYIHIFYLMVITSNVFIYFSAELRPYSLLTLLITVSSIYLYKSYNNRYFYDFLFLAIVNSLIVYTHTSGILWVITQQLIFLFFIFFDKKSFLFKSYLIANTIMLTVISPWIWVLIDQLGRAKGDFWILFDAIKSLKEYRGIFLGIERIDEINTFIYYKLFIGISYILGGIGVFSLYRRLKKSRILIINFLMIVVNFYLFSYFIQPILYSRYLTFLNPFSIIFIFVGIYGIVIFLMKYIRSNIFLNIIFIIISITYILFRIFLIKDMYVNINRTNYFYLNEYSSISIYSNEPLDIMSCSYYSNSCYFVDNNQDNPQYIGNMLLSNIKKINDWINIQDKYFAIIYKDYNESKLFKKFENLNYVQIDKKFIGDHSFVGVFMKE